MPPRKALAKLPNAPLAEAVFEYLWTLPGPEQLPSVVKSDPGYWTARDEFTNKAKRLGFVVFRDMTGETEVPGGHSVGRRFYREVEREFPLLQIGPGIFASNQSAEYEWKSFKRQTLSGLKAALDAYPRMAATSMRPLALELRYVDAFDASLLGTTDLIAFAHSGLRMTLDVPVFADLARQFAGEYGGRIILQRQLKGWKDTRFQFDIGSGKRKQDAIVRMETKVRTEKSGMPPLRSANHRSFLNQIGQWLEFAHGITSPFFKELIRPELMQKFEQA
jgi:uncharacterized protein (TIGR04255 family)